MQRPLLACYPRDLVNQIVDFSAYHGRKAEFTPDMLRLGLAQLFRFAFDGDAGQPRQH